jgi:hypothetical protein
MNQRYRAVFIDADGSEVETRTFHYDVALHESFGSVVPAARTKLVIDSPSLNGDASQHVGLFNLVALPGRVVVCSDTFTWDFDGPNTHRLAVEASEAAGMGYPFAGPLVIVDEIE